MPYTNKGLQNHNLLKTLVLAHLFMLSCDMSKFAFGFAFEPMHFVNAEWCFF